MLRALVLGKYLEGVHSAPAIAAAIAAPDQEEEIAAYLRSAEFHTAVLRAKKDMAASVIDTIKAKLHTLLGQYLELTECNDPRVRAAVIKDLLDRGGTGATSKVALTTPDAYRKAIEEYIEKAPANGADAGNDVPGGDTLPAPTAE
jgi:hypothetical protein